MEESKPPKPVSRLGPHRFELVHPTYQPSKSELEESIALPQMSLEEAACRLMEAVEIHYIDKPRRES